MSYKQYLVPLIEEVEQNLINAIKSQHPTLEEAAAHILSSGGKRVRPMFVLLSGAFGKGQHESLINTATSLEIIHMASLVHDDFIDSSNERRGTAAVHEAYSNMTAVRTGHFLLASALQNISSINDEAYHRLLSKTIKLVCFGEFEQMADRFRYPITFSSYLRRINRKTAILIEASCLLGAMSTNASVSHTAALGRFGHYIGMCYQIIDDILDYESDAATLGKPVGSDIRNGHITLPLICAMKNDESLKEVVSSLNIETDDKVYEDIIQTVKKNGTKEARTIADIYAEKALRELHSLPDCSEKQYLKAIHKKISQRTL